MFWVTVTDFSLYRCAQVLDLHSDFCLIRSFSGEYPSSCDTDFVRHIGAWLLTCAKDPNSGWAVAFTGACAVHPGFVLLTRVDLGPIALMLFLKALCLVLLFKWLDGPQRICWSVFGVCILGFFDKFNFIWFVVALAFSTSAIYGAEIFRKLRTVPVRVLLAIATHSSR
jgi:hypothetical protein